MFEQGRYRGRIANYGVARSQGRQGHPTVFVEFDLIGRYDPATGQLVPCPRGDADVLQGGHAQRRSTGWPPTSRPSATTGRAWSTSIPRRPGRRTCSASRSTSTASTRPTRARSASGGRSIASPSREKLRRDELATLDAQFADTFSRILGAGKPTVAPAVNRDEHRRSLSDEEENPLMNVPAEAGQIASEPAGAGSGRAVGRRVANSLPGPRRYRAELVCAFHAGQPEHAGELQGRV